MTWIKRIYNYKLLAGTEATRSFRAAILLFPTDGGGHWLTAKSMTMFMVFSRG